MHQDTQKKGENANLISHSWHRVTPLLTVIMAIFTWAGHVARMEYQPTEF